MQLFGIQSSNFEELYKIVTDGQGKESLKVNSLRSSSLLSLLCFHRLSEYKSNDKDKNSITIHLNNENINFSNCFFEVRNKVIRLPSNIDLALISEDETTILFLESKFTEYAEEKYLKSVYSLKTGYKGLYTDPKVKKMFADSGIMMNETDLTLEVSIGKHLYLEGIKQSISHLIGILRGPQRKVSGYYPDDYFNLYSKAFNKAKRIIYGTILYDLTELGGTLEFCNYVSLFENTLGKHSAEVIKCVRENFKTISKNFEVEIISEPLTYQEIFKDFPNRNFLTNNVLTYYNL